jgi:hypothetical protein
VISLRWRWFISTLFLRGAHLIDVAGKEFVPLTNFDFSDSLDAFEAFYVNKYADHHSHEIAF